MVEQKELLFQELKQLSFVEKIFPSDANFILVKVKDANKLYNHLSGHEVIVRNRSKDVHCANCLRITIGTQDENSILINLLQNYER